jgi:DNA polymerase-3 subunit gamma/tau
MELYKKYRPKTFKGVLGQEAAVSSLVKLIEKGQVPHAILLSGPSGCGKTTIARILKNVLQCSDADFTELNCADFKGIDMIRDIRRHSSLHPLAGKCRMWVIDEAHKLTNDAQNAFLKILEDTPSHVYFVLCTTDPQKLLKTIITRCTEIKLQPLSHKDLTLLIQRVAYKEGAQLSEEVVDEIVEAADGSARKALVILEQVLQLPPEQQVDAVRSMSLNKDKAIDLARALIDPRTQWADVAKILSNLDDDPEAVRNLVLEYARKVLLGGGKLAPRAFKVIDVFSANFWDSKRAGLAAACYEVLHFE